MMREMLLVDAEAAEVGRRLADAVARTDEMLASDARTILRALMPQSKGGDAIEVRGTDNLRTQLGRVTKLCNEAREERDALCDRLRRLEGDLSEEESRTIEQLRVMMSDADQPPHVQRVEQWVPVMGAAIDVILSLRSEVERRTKERDEAREQSCQLEAGPRGSWYAALSEEAGQLAVENADLSDRIEDQRLIVREELHEQVGIADDENRKLRAEVSRLRFLVGVNGAACATQAYADACREVVRELKQRDIPEPSGADAGMLFRWHGWAVESIKVVAGG